MTEASTLLFRLYAQTGIGPYTHCIQRVDCFQRKRAIPLGFICTVSKTCTAFFRSPLTSSSGDAWTENALCLLLTYLFKWWPDAQGVRKFCEVKFEFCIWGYVSELCRWNLFRIFMWDIPVCGEYKTGTPDDGSHEPKHVAPCSLLFK